MAGFALTGRGLATLLVAFLALVGCVPVQQGALRPVQSPSPALLEDRFESFDGARLGLSIWRPAGAEDASVTAAIIAVHGMNDYAGAFNAAGPWWAAQGAVVYAYDQRGFGRSPRPGVWARPEVLREDLRTIVRLVRERHPHARLAVVGESMGASVAMTAFSSSRPPAADRLVLSGPGLRGWGALPGLYRVSLWMSAHVRPAWIVTPPKGVSVTATDNREKLIEMWNDPLVLKTTRIDSVYGVVSLMEEADRTIAALPPATPTLFLYGARDEVIPEFGVRRAALRLPEHVRTAYYLKGLHMLMNDLQAETVWRDVLSFILDPDGALPSAAPELPFPRP